METTENPYKYRMRESHHRDVNGEELEGLTLSAIHHNSTQPLGAVATLKGGRAALPERAVVNTRNQGTDERIFAPGVKGTKAGSGISLSRPEMLTQSEWENNHTGGRRAYQTTLFDVAPEEPAKAPTLGVLASTVGESHLVPSVLGLAGHESMRRYGVMPMPDASLSKDSSRIVQRLVKHGVIDPNPENPESKPSNSLDRESDRDFPSEVVALERHHIRTTSERYTDARMRGATTGPHPVTEVDPMIGSQFLRQRLAESKKAREGQ